MGKRFEDTRTPTLAELTTAYTMLGLGSLIGQAGANTSCWARHECTDETLSIHTLPGRWTSEEIAELLAILA